MVETTERIREDGHKILDVMGDTPCHLDDIQKQTDIERDQVWGVLKILEMEGKVIEKSVWFFLKVQ